MLLFCFSVQQLPVVWLHKDIKKNKIFSIPKVLIVQSMVNKETFVVKVSIPFN